ncbi:MAG: NADH-quinone oxidoreductase subunit B, partial [Anaerolineae bacterium]
TPQALINGLIALQEKIDQQSFLTAPWYSKDNTMIEEVPIPVLGPDLVDVRQVELIQAEAAKVETAVAETEVEAA